MSNTFNYHHPIHTKQTLNTSKRGGFTIVELLIVIVVIAILAAISIVAYNGIQQRAEASRIVTLVKGYVNALELYRVDNGAFPNSPTCLGPAADFPGDNCADAVGWNSNNPYSPSLNTILDDYRGKSASAADYSYATSGNPAGVMWYHNSYWGKNHQVLGYLMPPTQDCGLSNIQSNVTHEVEQGRKYTAKYSNATLCVLQLD